MINHYCLCVDICCTNKIFLYYFSQILTWLFSATGNLAEEATKFYKRPAFMLATKWQEPYTNA